MDVFHDIGKAVCVSVLDLADKNEYSRVVNTEHSDLKGFKGEVAFDLLQRTPFRFDPLMRKYLKDKEGLTEYLETEDARVPRPIPFADEAKPWQGKKKKGKRRKKGIKVEIFVNPESQFRKRIVKRRQTIECGYVEMLPRQSRRSQSLDTF